MSLLFGGLGLTLGACDSDPDAFPEPEACDAFDYAGFDPGPTLNFHEEVRPLFGRCAGSTCHGSPRSSAAGLYLAMPAGDTPEDATERARIVAESLIVPARTTPDLPRITPGRPDQSLLMHKLDGSHDCLGLTCPGGDCGLRMPRGGTPLSAEERDVIRRWIAQGARAN
ncbi:MAG: hypothetical protein KIT72_01490 [Polyangiaceae bacterium]|nr:hypothetical protein [Polyangiaceae bacterium]MCW5789070.1 hypothetical protein [Polyangiaceae bacterium]